MPGWFWGLDFFSKPADSMKSFDTEWNYNTIINAWVTEAGSDSIPGTWKLGNDNQANLDIVHMIGLSPILYYYWPKTFRLCVLQLKWILFSKTHDAA